MFTKEDIAIALSDALMVHLVAKDSKITQKQEAMRAFGAGLIKEQDSNVTAAESIGNNLAIEHLNKEYSEEFLKLHNKLLVSDKIELMVKNFGESHGKVTLYKNIVRDVSVLHSAQLGMNINDLPGSHHEEIARDVYSTISEWSSKYTHR